MSPVTLTNRAREIGPYEYVRVTIDGIEHVSSIMSKVTQDKCLVIASAGLDSTTVIGLQKEKYDVVDLVHFTYGCKAQEKELDRIKKIAEYYGSKLYIIDLSLAFNNIESTLFNDEDNIVDGILGTEIAMEWIPSRNLVFLSHAIALAESKGYNIVSTGVNLEESGAYPDNEENMFIKMNDVLFNAVNWNKSVRIENPLSNDMKYDIVRRGLELNVPFYLTWSCYRNGDKICKSCAPCRMRRVAFERNGMMDPLLFIKEENQIKQ